MYMAYCICSPTKAVYQGPAIGRVFGYGDTPEEAMKDLDAYVEKQQLVKLSLITVKQVK